MIGYQSNLNLSQLNNILGANAVAMRAACEESLRFFNEVVNVLGVTGLQASPFNMTATDAQAFFNVANYLQTVAQIYFGLIAQAVAFNFDTATAAARSGQ